MQLHQKKDLNSFVSEHSLSSSILRSQRREQILGQNRNFPPPIQHEIKETTPTPDNYLIRMHELKVMLQNVDLNVVFKAVTELRMYTLGDGYVPLEEMIEANIISTLINVFASCNNENIQYEILWFYTNIATLDTGTVAILIRCQVVNIVGELCSQKIGKVAIQAAWFFGNIASEGNEYRNIVFESGFLRILERSFESGADGVKIGIWALSNTVKVKPFLGVNAIGNFVHRITNILAGGGINEVRDAVICILYLSYESTSVKQLMSTSVYFRIFMLSGSNNEVIQNACLRTMTLLSTKCDEEIFQLFIVSNIIPYLTQLFNETDSELVKKQVGFIFSNLVLANSEFIDLLISLDFYETVVNSIVNRSNAPSVDKELFYVMFNSITTHRIAAIEHFLQFDFFVTSFKYLPKDDTDFLNLALTVVIEILTFNPDILDLKDQFIEIGFDEFLDELVNSDNVSLSENAATLLSFYFDNVIDV
ncbi:Importin alpha [Entamoeba marina]